MYENYLADPDSVAVEWKDFFQSLPNANGNADISHSTIESQFKALGKVSRYTPLLSNDAVVHSEHESKQV